MNIKLKDLKLEKVRAIIELEDNHIKVFNATGENRDELLKELLRAVDLYDGQEFGEYWYNYLIKNYTNVAVGGIKIVTLLENPTVQFLKLKRALDEMVNEVYLDMLLTKIDELEQQKIALYTQAIKNQVVELNRIGNEIGGE